MLTVLVSGLRGPGLSPLAGDIALCSGARHFTHVVPFSIQAYTRVPVNLVLGVTSRKDWKYAYSLHATETGDKCLPDGPLGSYADFAFTCLFVQLIIFIYVLLVLIYLFTTHMEKIYSTVS